MTPKELMKPILNSEGQPYFDVVYLTKNLFDNCNSKKIGVLLEFSAYDVYKKDLRTTVRWWYFCPIHSEALTNTKNVINYPNYYWEQVKNKASSTYASLHEKVSVMVHYRYVKGHKMMWCSKCDKDDEENGIIKVVKPYKKPKWFY